MRAASGEGVAFLDADDIWTPDHLSSVCAVLRPGEADLAYSDCYVFRETPTGEMELLPIETIEVKDPPVDLFRRNFINPSGAVITRALMEKVGGFDSRRVEDLDYWIRSAAAGFRIGPTRKKTYYYRKSSTSLSAAFAKDAEALGEVFMKHRRCGILPEEDILTRAKDSFYAAGKMYWRKDPADARRAFYKSWKLGKMHVLPLVCASLAAAMIPLQPFRAK